MLALVLTGTVVVGYAAGAAGAALMIARSRRGRGPVDAPDPRRLHQTPTPRGGGVGVSVAAIATVPLALSITASGSEARLVALAVAWALVNGAIGLIDDHRPLGASTKLVVQLAAAAGVVALGLRIDELGTPPLGAIYLGPAGAVFSILWLVWLVNVFNFMDGMDALAAGCGALFCAALATAALATGVPGIAAIALAVGGGLGGFLRYNAPPARIFMGDVGSLFAGGALGAIGIALTHRDGGQMPIAVPTLVIAPFAWDATWTLVRRLRRGERLGEAHRTHLYQRLAGAGWPHTRVRAVYVTLSLVCAGAAAAVLRGGAAVQGIALAGVAAALLGLVLVTSRAERARPPR